MDPLTVLNAAWRLGQQAVPPSAVPAAGPDWGALGYSALLVAAGVLGGATVGAGWGFLTKKAPSSQDFITGAVGGAGVGVGMVLAQALRGRTL